MRPSSGCWLFCHRLHGAALCRVYRDVRPFICAEMDWLRVVRCLLLHHDGGLADLCVVARLSIQVKTTHVDCRLCLTVQYFVRSGYCGGCPDDKDIAGCQYGDGYLTSWYQLVFHAIVMGCHQYYSMTSKLTLITTSLPEGASGIELGGSGQSPVVRTHCTKLHTAPS